MGRNLARVVSAADLCQESFLRSFEALARLPEAATLADYEDILYRNARWVIGSAVRKHRRFRGESAADLEPERRPDPAGARSSGSVTREDEERWFSAQVDRLRPDQAAVVALRMQGCEFADIATRLGITEHAARKRYLRGAIELRRLTGSHRED
jgi:RNA polymerase sigma factor (sigma-70 family)